MSLPPASRKSFSIRFLSGLAFCSIVLFLIVAFFRPVLFENRQFSFRDDAYFYIPLFQQIQIYWKQHEIPLWDPDTNLGQPLAANPAASVYYPLKLVFFLPCLLPVDFHSCYKFYTLFHVVWGMCGMFFLIRQFRCSRGASLISCVSYMFAGSVLIQYCNIIFLIGAAWVPWIVLCGDRLLRKPRPANFLALAVALALTVLGGDPQAAYCIGLALVALAFLYWKTGVLAQSDARNLPRDENQITPENTNNLPHTPFKILFQRLGLLFLSAVTAGLLATVQIMPAHELSRHSDRTLSDMPYSVWDVPPVSIWNIPGYLAKWNAFSPGKTPEKIAANRPDSPVTGILNGLLCRQLSEGGHTNAIYSFSVMPYHFVDLLWPNFDGKSTPENGKWDPYAVSWFNSMYMGAFVFLLALTAIRLRLKKRVTSRSFPNHNTYQNMQRLPRRTLAVWATWALVIAALASLGGYGPCWFWRILTARGNTSWSVENGDPVGGVYWFLTVFLPGFESFRYPAKMTVYVSFALAILAGIGWDCCRTKKLILKLCSWSICLSVLAVLIVCASGPRLFDISITQDTTMGAYNPQTAFSIVRNSLIQTICVLVCFRVLLSWNIRSRKTKQEGPVHYRHISPQRRKSILVSAIIIMLLLDLYLAHASTIVTCPTEFYKCPSVLAEKIHENQTDDSKGIMPPRVYTMEWYPLVLAKRKGPSKDFTRGLWDRLTLIPNQHYSYGLQNVHFSGTMNIDEYFFCRTWAEMPDKNDVSALMAFLDVQSLIFPRVLTIPEQGQEPVIKLDRNNVQLLIAADKETTEPQDAQGVPVDVAAWNITLPTTRIKIFHDYPALDDPMFSTIDLLRSGRIDDRKENEYARMTRYGHNRLEFETRLTHPGDIVLAEQYFPGWQAYFNRLDETPSTSGQPLEIRQTLGFLRRITLPAGTYHVVMEYRPQTFTISASISTVAWLLLFLVAIGLFFRKPRARTRNNITKPFEPEAHPASGPSV